MKQNDTFENNNNRGNKSKTIRRGYFMKYFLNFLLVINGIFGSISAQQYPVRLVPVVFPPYNVRLSDYALNSEPKLQLQVLMTDLLEPPHKTGIKFSLESGGRVIAVSNPFVNGLDPFMLHPGSPISLSNLDLKPLFKLENLSGISPANYAKALPDGLYQYCFQAYDFYTKNNLSQKSCASVYQVLYDPPFLNLPQKGEKVTKKAEFQGVVFNWSPRQVAPNTKYIFTLKEIWDKQRDPVSAFLAARVLWKEESFAPSLYYGVDKTQLIPGRRYAWQVQAVSGTPQYNHSPIQEGGVYKNNGLSEIFFFDYVENCPVPAFLMAKTAARGRAEIQWMLQGAFSKQFRVEYRKKGSSSPWLSETSYQTSAILSGLENNTEYEYRVGAVCGENKSFDPNDLSQADAFAYSGVQYFTTNFSNQNKNSAQCGVMPHVDLANKKPYDRQLTPNEVFTAGDFPVTVITAQGTAGNYTGEGFIQVPYLADTKIKVKFNNIQLNSDKQLINGTVETEYDANESAVHYASAGLGEIFGDKGIKDIKINYEIEKITLVMTPAPGVLRIVGIDPNGENKGPVQELPAGRDYTITDSNGKIWQVDENGNVSQKNMDNTPPKSNPSHNIDNIHNSGNDINDEKSDNDIQFIYENNDYKSSSTIFAMIDSDDLDISIMSKRNSEILNGELTWFFNKKELQKGNSLTSIKLSTKNLKNKTYDLVVKKDNKELAKLKIEFYNTPILKFELPDNYDQSFLFDNEFVKNKIVAKDYELLSTIKDYRVPVLAASKDKIVNLNLNINGVPRNIKDFEITIKEDNTSNIMFINGSNVVKMNNIKGNISFKITKNTNFRKPIYLNALYQNKIIGKLKIYSYPIINKNVQLVYIKWNNTDNHFDINEKELEKYLQNKSLNQLFLNINIPPSLKIDLSNNHQLSNQLNELIENFQDANKEGAKMLDIFYDEYNKIKTIDSDDVLFMVNKNIKSIKDDETGGFHKTGGIGGVILKSSLDSAEAIAHELGHWLDLRHTKDEGTPTSIPESQTQNNFMDYNIKRKSWFRHQLDKTYKKNEQSN